MKFLSIFSEQLSTFNIYSTVRKTDVSMASVHQFLSWNEHIVIFLFLLAGVACQVSSAVVSAVSALTYQLGQQLAPIIIEHGAKV